MNAHLTRALRFTLVLIMVFSALPRPWQAGAQPPGGPDDPAEMGAFLDGAFAIQMAANHVPGAVVTVVRDGQEIYAQGYGYADLERRIPVDPQRTLFRPGSVTKLFTYTAVMQLVEQGRLSLSEDVNTHLDFTIPATYADPITLQHLLTHTPGFEDAGEGLFVLAPEQIIPLDEIMRSRIPARVYPPGEVAAYSNYGAALLGYIVERAAGIPFHQYVAENIFQPLGMTRSTLDQPLPDDLAPDMARGYNYFNGEYVEGAFEIVLPYPAGSLSAPASDMARFMIAHLQNGRFGDTRILAEETARLMHSPLYSPNPRLHGMAHGFFENEVNGQVVLSHGGDTLLFHSGLFLLPEHNLGIFISTSGVGGAGLAQQVFEAFMDRYFPAAPQAETSPPDSFGERAALYTGEYYLSRANFTTIEKLLRVFSPVTVQAAEPGELLVTMAGLGVVRYREVEPGLLAADEGPMPVLALGQAPDGQIALHTSLPWVLIKAPWYATATATLLIFGGGLVLFLITLGAWLAGAIARLRRTREPMRPGARLARLAAGLFMLVFLSLVGVLLAVMLDIDPAFGAPRLFFETPPVLAALGWLAPALYVLGALALVFLILAWVRRYWTPGGRVFYSLLVAWFAAILWAATYWNLLAG